MLQQTVQSVIENAPAKINLALHITGRRADGYHLLESLVVFTELGDRLTLGDKREECLDVEGPFGDNLPHSDDNLIVRARDRLRAALPAGDTRPVSIRLEKNLPIASGIGGGSSDAAAALKGLARLWRLGANDAWLAQVGASLGADVPMCLVARPLIARGIGEVIEVLPDFPELPMVLVNPGVAVSTPEVFRALAKRDNGGLPPLPDRLDFGGICGWLEATRNDLDPPARMLQPVIGEALDELSAAGAAFARMSGSGATCFGLFETRAAAERAAADIGRRRNGWFVKATRSLASEASTRGQD